MPTDTDIRLRTRLDSNQRDREQMSRAILALDPHYSDVRPRHPSGGPDGGRDIEAKYDETRIAFGAVGFLNGANDSEHQKKRIRKKFSEDLRSAISAKADLRVFVFFTNINLTLNEKSKLIEDTRKFGIEYCEIFDRERMRIELDSPAGFFIRFQYLGIPLSEPEQASFLAHYGDRIQQVVSTGFQRIERTLNRLLFLQEATNVLGKLTFRFELKDNFPANEIGHFRAFVNLALREAKHGIMEIWFGSTDKSLRFYPEVTDKDKRETPGIANGIASGAWEYHLTDSKSETFDKNSMTSQEYTKKISDEYNEQFGFDDSELTFVSCGSAMGIDPVRTIFVNYNHDSHLIRLQPRLSLRDLDDCMFMPMMNLSLAEKLFSIEIFANGYKLAHIGLNDFKIDATPFRPYASARFTVEELIDPWVRIRPAGIASTFELHFASTTPRRMFGHDETPHQPRLLTT